jgi:hypothetical protein
MFSVVCFLSVPSCLVHGPGVFMLFWWIPYVIGEYFAVISIHHWCTLAPPHTHTQPQFKAQKQPLPVGVAAHH